MRLETFDDHFRPIITSIVNLTIRKNVWSVCIPDPIPLFLSGICPVLCSGNGDYEEGACRCYPGWKGGECQLRHDECVVADCGGHGKCVDGGCACARGFTGEACQESE